MYDDDDYEGDEYIKIIHKADYHHKEKEHYHDKGDDHFDVIQHIKLNSLLGILILLGVICLPMAIAAEINIHAISAQIADLSRLLTTYYTSLSTTLALIVNDLATVMTSLTNLRNTVNTQSNTLQTIINLINNIPIGRSVDIGNHDYNFDVSADSLHHETDGVVEIKDGATGYANWYIAIKNEGLNNSFVDEIATDGFDKKVLTMCLEAAQSQRLVMVS